MDLLDLCLLLFISSLMGLFILLFILLIINEMEITHLLKKMEIISNAFTLTMNIMEIPSMLNIAILEKSNIIINMIGTKILKLIVKFLQEKNSSFPSSKV